MVNAGGEWLLTTITDLGPTELIAVASSPWGLRPGGKTAPTSFLNYHLVPKSFVFD
jgi:hypothetical protein